MPALWRRIRRAMLSFSIFLVCSTGLTSAYRVGEAVDTDILIGSVSTDALRSQMPSFGVGSSFYFPVTDEIKYFSLRFQDGLLGIPTLYTQNMRGQSLARVVVTFVYSKSGVGDVHAVNAQPEYMSIEGPHEDIQIEYQWIQEEAGQLRAGIGIMFFASLFVSILFLFQLCGIIDDHDELEGQRNAQTRVPEGTYMQKKW
jgi:hypothetical protein